LGNVPRIDRAAWLDERTQMLRQRCKSALSLVFTIVYAPIAHLGTILDLLFLNCRPGYARGITGNNRKQPTGEQ